MHMKTRLATVVIGALCSSSASGFDFLPNLYLGIEGAVNHYKAEKSVQSKNPVGNVITRGNNKALLSEHGAAGGVFIGSNLLDLVGLEVGFMKFKNGKVEDNLLYNASMPGVSALQVQSINTFSAQHHNWYLDALGYIPLPFGLDIIGSVGVGRLSSKLKNSIRASAFIALPPQSARFSGANNLSTDSTKTGLRLGLGAQYKFCDAGVRLMVRYQKGNDILRNVISGGLGLFYQFY